MTLIKIFSGSLLCMYVVFRSAMAIEGEEDVSDDQESETEDCDTEEDEGNIV